MNGSRTAPWRTRRDWIVDICVFVLAVVYGVAMSVLRIDDASVSPWVLSVDQVAGAAGCAALWLRRRWPVGLTLALAALSTFSELVAGALVAALFTVAVHRPSKDTATVLAVSVLAIPVYATLRPEPGMSPAESFLFTSLLGTAIYLAAVGWGLFIRHRRQLVLRAATEARLRAEQAQHDAREQIAREMHDVLGHRLSLLSVHAGALEYNPEAPASEIARAAAVIRDSAHQALQDLREVIGVLRAPIGELPQPTLADVENLAEESRRAGMRVRLRTETAGAVPDSVGRAAYRIVQEGLTNARRHAPGAEVRVTVRGAAGESLAVEVCNPAAAPPADASGAGSGAGRGLAGLAERAALLGGRLEYGPTAGGGFRLAAWLPWPS